MTTNTCSRCGATVAAASPTPLWCVRCGCSMPPLRTGARPRIPTPPPSLDPDPDEPITEAYMRTGEAARHLAVSPATVRRMLEAGHLIGRRYTTGDEASWWLVDRDSVRRMARLTRSCPAIIAREH